MKLNKDDLITLTDNTSSPQLQGQIYPIDFIHDGGFQDYQDLSKDYEETSKDTEFY